MDANLTLECAAVVYAEGRHLDSNDWDAWLQLFTEDAWWHIPMWVNEYEVTTDPQSELSLMWYPNRTGLEDRIFRLRTGASSASTPIPRTVHVISNVHIEEQDNGEILVYSAAVVSSYRHKNHDEFYCRYEHTLRREDGQLKIAGKKIIVSNDLIPDILDVYSV